MIKMPGLIDVHVHFREPGAIHKEDWLTGSSAALAGGVTMVLAMPNTSPPGISAEAIDQILNAAREKSVCDYGIYAGAGLGNYALLVEQEDRVVGLKMYLDQTYGDLRLDHLESWMGHFEHWPASKPIVVHAEKQTMAAVIAFSAIYDRKVHICHISRREEILMISKAKESGIPISCEVAPHHLFLCDEDIPSIGVGRAEVRPVLAGKADQEALWEHLDYIDCFATDHAPHLLSEKESDTPPPGFPGLETALPLLLQAVDQGRLTREDIIQKYYINPQKIFGLPDQKDTWIEIDDSSEWVFHGVDSKSRAGWSPFDGWKFSHKVQKVTLRGQVVYEDGQILAQPGFGKNILSV